MLKEPSGLAMTLWWSVIPLALLAGLALAAMAGLAAIGPDAPRLLTVPGERQTGVGEGVVRFQERGSGPEATVLLHGFNGQLADWDPVWHRLGACGRVLRLDLPGFGGSAWPTQDFGLPRQARRVIDFLDAQGVERAHLVGASMGGSLAAWIAAEHPQRVRSVLLLAPSGYPDSLHYGAPFGWLVKPGWPNRLAQWVARTAAYQALFPASRMLQATSVTASYGAPWAAALGRIRAPTLLIWSSGDASFHAADQVAAAIPSGRLLPVAAEAGHLLPRTAPALAAGAACRLAQGEPIEPLLETLRAMPLSDAEPDGPARR